MVQDDRILNHMLSPSMIEEDLAEIGVDVDGSSR